MAARNGEHGYGWVTKCLHWLTVVVLVAQFAVGWSMSDDAYAYDAVADRAEERLDAREEAAEQRGEAAEEAFEAEQERREGALDAQSDAFVDTAFDDVLSGAFLGHGVTGAEVHVLLGLSVLLLAVARALWRRRTPLPPWADHLSGTERRLEGGLEKAMLTLLFVVPATGLLLVLEESEWLPVHVTAQFALLATVVVHVGLVLRHTVVRRERHLSRML